MKDSDEIITEPEQVKTCWTDYFQNLLNVDTQGNDEIVESRFEDYMNIKESTEDEVKRAVDRSRNGKAGSPPSYVCAQTYISMEEGDVI